MILDAPAVPLSNTPINSDGLLTPVVCGVVINAAPGHVSPSAPSVKLIRLL